MNCTGLNRINFKQMPFYISKISERQKVRSADFRRTNTGALLEGDQGAKARTKAFLMYYNINK